MALLSEYPQGYWEGNQFILPTLPPPPPQVAQAPVVAAPPPINPLLRVKPLLPQSDNGGDYMPPPDPNVSDQFDAGASLRFGPEVDETHPYGSGQRIGLGLGTGAGLLGGIPGLGALGSLLGARSDIYDIEQAMEDIGYARPDLSTWDAWDPFGAQAFGWTPDTSPYSQLMEHFMGITDPTAPGYAQSGMQELWSEDLDVPGLGSSEEAIRGAIADAESDFADGMGYGQGQSGDIGFGDDMGW